GIVGIGFEVAIAEHDIGASTASVRDLQRLDDCAPGQDADLRPVRAGKDNRLDGASIRQASDGLPLHNMTRKRRAASSGVRSRCGIASISKPTMNLRTVAERNSGG